MFVDSTNLCVYRCTCTIMTNTYCKFDLVRMEMTTSRCTCNTLCGVECTPRRLFAVRNSRKHDGDLPTISLKSMLC